MDYELRLLLSHMRPTTLATMYNDLTEYEPINRELAVKVYQQLSANVGDEQAMEMIEAQS